MSTNESQTLTCTDRCGMLADFTLTVEHDASEAQWTYRVRPQGASAQSEFFELKVVEVDDDTVQVVMLTNNQHPPVSAKGIPDSLIPRIAQDLRRRVQSSPSRGRTGDEYRTGAATKVWERLVGAQKAQYDSQADVYFVSKPVQTVGSRESDD